MLDDKKKPFSQQDSGNSDGRMFLQRFRGYDRPTPYIRTINR